VRHCWLQSVEAVIERQQRMATEGDNGRFFASVRTEERISFGPTAASPAWLRLRHFCTVVGLMP
jgi:hypothetical protein